MPNSESFFEKYGSVSFDDMPFCDGDNVGFCQTFYLPLEEVAPNSLDDEPMAFDEMERKMFELRGSKHKPVGIMLTKNISIHLEMMAKAKRYSEIKVVGAQSVFCVNPATQFGAITYLLPNGQIVVIFRGTDDTIVGWKEDLDLYITKGVPSQKLAAEYLDNVAEKFKGEIIVLGHSKGGNLALYGGLYCKDETRERIVSLYNNDGPGFYDFDYLDSYQYKQLLPKYKHYVPHSSFVGMILAHDDDYTVVKSNKSLGAMQHDLDTWQMDESRLLTKEDINFVAKVIDVFLAKLLLTIPQDMCDCVNEIATSFIEGMDEKYLTDFVKNIVPSIKGGIEKVKPINEGTKELAKAAFEGAGKKLKEAFLAVKDDKFPSAKAKADEIAKLIFT